MMERIARLARNPILRRETRSRLRGHRTAIVLTAFMLVMSVAFYVAYKLVLMEYRYQMGRSSEAGRYVFVTLAVIECGLIMLLAPAFSCATITSERERKTFDLLRSTLLRPKDILLGKLNASVYFLLMLIISSLPVFSTCLLLGGLSPLNILVCVLILLGTTFFYALLGLFFSVMFRRTATAAALAYVSALALNLLPLGIAVFFKVLFRNNKDLFLVIAACTSPITNMLETLIPDLHRQIAQEIHVYSHAITWPLYLVLAVLMWRAMRRRLGREMDLTAH